MDIVTHIIIGGIVSQIPSSRTSGCSEQKSEQLNWRLRATIGATAAIFPDIDFLLFWIDPLEFLAYWHRTVTHSILLLPVWALILSYFVVKLTRIADFALVFVITLLGILSHIGCDWLTVFGTQLLAPLSNTQFSANLLFVIDPYFTILLLACAFGICLKQRKELLSLLMMFMPVIYLAGVVLIKYQLTDELTKNNLTNSSMEPTVVLLPQPFSPLYWQAITTTENRLGHTYLKLATDPIAVFIRKIVGIEKHDRQFYYVNEAKWSSWANLNYQSQNQSGITKAWNRPEFKAYRDFSRYPVYLDSTSNAGFHCFWFSDLRYHWPGIPPPFKYGICRDNEGKWRTRRQAFLDTLLLSKLTVLFNLYRLNNPARTKNSEMLQVLGTNLVVVDKQQKSFSVVVPIPAISVSNALA